MSLNIASLVRESAKAYPDKPALLFDDDALTFAEVDDLSDRLAHGLRARGLRPGDRVALQLPNLPQFVIAYFGILKAGCVVVPMNVLLKAPEITHQLMDSGARALITWSGSAWEANQAAKETGIDQVYLVEASGAPGAEVGTAFDELLTNLGPDDPPLEQIDSDDTAALIYPSGAIGRRKAPK